MARRGYPGHRTTAFSTPRKTSEAAVTFIVWNSKARAPTAAHVRK